MLLESVRPQCKHRQALMQSAIVWKRDGCMIYALYCTISYTTKKPIKKLRWKKMASPLKLSSFESRKSIIDLTKIKDILLLNLQNLLFFSQTFVKHSWWNQGAGRWGGSFVTLSRFSTASHAYYCIHELGKICWYARHMHSKRRTKIISQQHANLTAIEF